MAIFKSQKDLEQVYILSQLYQLDTFDESEVNKWCLAHEPNDIFSEPGDTEVFLEGCKRIPEIASLTRRVMDSLYEHQALMSTDISKLNGLINTVIGPDNFAIQDHLLFGESFIEETFYADNTEPQLIPLSHVAFSTQSGTFDNNCLKKLIDLINYYRDKYRNDDFFSRRDLAKHEGLFNPLQRCSICGSVFMPNRTDAIYCSDRCGGTARSRRRRQNY